MKRKTAILKSVLLALSIVSATSASAQTMIYYSYDASGNRISRSTTVSQTRSVTEEPERLTDEFIPTNIVSIIQHPSIDMITVKINGWDYESPAIIDIYNMAGYSIFHKSARQPETDIDLSTYSVGFYILQVTIGDKKNIWKITKG